MRVRTLLAVLTLGLGVTTGCHHGAEGPLSPSQISDEAACGLLTQARATRILGTAAVLPPVPDEPGSASCGYHRGRSTLFLTLADPAKDPDIQDASTVCRLFPADADATPTFTATPRLGKGAGQCTITHDGTLGSDYLTWTAGGVAYSLHVLLVTPLPQGVDTAILEAAIAITHG